MLEAAEFCTLYITPAAFSEGWNSYRVIVVSALLRETILALDHPLTSVREQLLISLALDEITYADMQALGVPMPHPQSGYKRLQAAASAVRSRHAYGRRARHIGRMGVRHWRE